GPVLYLHYTTSWSKGPAPCPTQRPASVVIAQRPRDQDDISDAGDLTENESSTRRLTSDARKDNTNGRYPEPCQTTANVLLSCVLEKSSMHHGVLREKETKQGEKGETRKGEIIPMTGSWARR
ncbi:hypothetical protein CTA1_13372, partial [Colletotrichum tanaceti]